ncbi:gluconokinase [Vibrio ezurae]|uniref:Gluconokinase n=1 Tax=Vibrio ezurae NBRC 102218 TaxID=1219080 RepID=U3CGL4_9VIBR|nr:gluconokinase [Vibrio ezurae]GAD80354.1 putative gluconokinase [Vibrio ezurae NBRC 102218]
MEGKSIVIMGVSGSGKSTIGELLAARLSAKFIDGDDLHPKANVIKMASGTPLDDSDRTPWLERINDAIYSIYSKNETCVFVCSALKKKYRDAIRNGNENVRFVFLEGSQELVLERVHMRSSHFMKSDMVDSQFAILEQPVDEDDVITIDISLSVDEMLDDICSRLGSSI